MPRKSCPKCSALMRLKNDASDSLSYEWECTANPEHTAETLSEKSGTAVDLGLIGTGVVSLLVTGGASAPVALPVLFRGIKKLWSRSDDKY